MSPPENVLATPCEDAALRRALSAHDEAERARLRRELDALTAAMTLAELRDLRLDADVILSRRT